MKEPDYGPWIQLVDGEPFFFENPQPESIVIEDIAESIGKLCRYTGHVRRFYSVAQHSVMVSKLVPRDLALTGLMHDATEAYIGDINRPLKRMLGEPIKQIEQRIWEAIAAKFGLPKTLPPDIKHADNVALLVERRDLMAQSKLPWGSWADGYVLPRARLHRIWGPDEAPEKFMERFAELTGDKHV